MEIIRIIIRLVHITIKICFLMLLLEELLMDQNSLTNA